MNNNSLKIAVAETSVIIRSGLAAVLKRLPNLNVQPVEIATPESLAHYLQLHTPDIVIANPTFGGWFDLHAVKHAHPKTGIKYMALVSTVIDPNVLKTYDGHFSILDDTDTIAAQISHLLHTDEEEEENEQDVLSQREKEIITCVVKGMTNKAIADKLYLSVHTIITHRRNIARKLQIHSPAGLTIYAIVNKLVALEDIKEQL